MTDDARLADLARAGDREAFEELVRRHADRLYGVLVRLLADPGDAEDAAQETFLRAWRGMPRFRGRSEFFTWLYRIGVNEAKRRAERRPRSAAALSVGDRDVEQRPDWSEAPDVRTEHRHLRAALERAIRELPFRYRTALVLRDVEGLSTREAAATVGIGEAAFKSRLHRARLVVRQAIDPYLEGERG